ncbi:MAG: HD domain-containing protein, partial [Bacilli bacterium]|nr:HD domain-containing protein [Bacilli bacterium]
QKVYEMIIIHEIAEAIVGDIVEGSAEHLTKSERERIAIYEIFKNLKNKDYFINLWEEFENRQTEEAKFVYEIDKLDPVLKAKYLDRKLKRDDLFEDFYDYEDNRGTFIDTPLQKLFYSNMY